MESQISPNSLLATVGRTPLVELGFLRDVPVHVTVHAKLESANPNGSLKDRPVARMLTRALAGGRLEGRRLLDSSSGNAGIAYAAFGASLGVAVTLVVPGNASQERIDRIRAHGAELILTDPLEGYDFAIAEAQRLADEQPDRYWYCNQYENEDNWSAHFDGTGEEIVRQMLGETGEIPDALVCGVGTGGSLTGVGRRLRKANPAVRIVSVVPELFPGVEGLKPLSTEDDLVPGILDESLIDEHVPVTTEDALSGCRELARGGIFAGPSSGAYVHVASQLARTGDFKRIVTLICDTGERYLTTGMWEAVREDTA